jgi:hypothetical protein
MLLLVFYKGKDYVLNSLLFGEKLFRRFSASGRKRQDRWWK